MIRNLDDVIEVLEGCYKNSHVQDRLLDQAIDYLRELRDKPLLEKKK